MSLTKPVGCGEGDGLINNERDRMRVRVRVRDKVFVELF